ncbi:MAG: DsbA family protein [Bacteriovoracaceae bacterium]|nr:DsbA family protein [Bacteriovoracaceae bacterium]
MSVRKFSLATLTFLVIGLIFFSCTEKVSSGPHFIFKPAPRPGIAAKVADTEISQIELHAEIESEIYEAQMRVYKLKFEKLKGMILAKMMKMDPNKKGLTDQEFTDKFILKGKEASETEINLFIAERKIPKEHINAQMKERIKQYLAVQIKKKAIDDWIALQTKKHTVEIYLTKPKRPVFDIEVGNAPFRGGANAKVTIVEFTDFQCPFCSKANDIMAELKKKYGDKIKIVYKNFPLPFHNHAKKAAEAALCAKEQSLDLFWKIHDEMFKNQDKLADKDLKELAKKVGLDVAKLESCLTSHKYAMQVQADIEQGKKVGVKSTPTFFVNGQMVNGALPVETFSEIIDEELKK